MRTSGKNLEANDEWLEQISSPSRDSSWFLRYAAANVETQQVRTKILVVAFCWMKRQTETILLSIRGGKAVWADEMYVCGGG